MISRKSGGRLRPGGALLALIYALAGTPLVFSAQQQAPAAPQAAGLRTLGTIKSVTGSSIVVNADNGSDVTVDLTQDTRMVRVAPGQKDLSGAVPLHIADLQVGDRLLVRGIPQQGSKNLKAVSVIVMKQTDVSAKREQEREDWQKHGVGGLVTAMDGSTGMITISAAGMGAERKSILVRTNKDTILRRYAPNSVKFDDAKPAALDQIKIGDQLRARGERSADGGELKAVEVVSGTFRNIAGTVAAVDAGAGTVTVQDAISKKPVEVKIAADSTVKKLPPEIAQRIATRLRGNGSAGGPQGQIRPQSGAGQPPGGGAVGEHASPPDLQRFLSRLPDTKLGELQKGEAVMIVSTEGSGSEAVTAITLLAGVEPILTAAPGGASSAILSPWTLSSSSAEAAAP
jgi:hypothetical protein